MNLLIFSRPGVRIYQELRSSETAWNALRFYEHLEISVGITIRISSLSAALSLASDLKYFVRRYGADHLFEITPGVYCTPAVVNSWYVTRQPVVDPWPWKIWYWVKGNGEIEKYDVYKGSFTFTDNRTMGGYVFEVHCSEEEYQVLRFL